MASVSDARPAAASRSTISTPIWTSSSVCTIWIVPELIDARGATTNVTIDQVRRLVQRAASTFQVAQLGPTAMVTDDPFTFGMARMYALLAEREGVAAEVFLDAESVNRWLGGLASG
jgi:hypothetical protein